MPSIEGSVKAILGVVKNNFNNPHLYLIHSNSSLEKQWFDEFKKQLSEQKDIEYTLFSWAASNRLLQMLKNDNGNVVVSIYDEAPGKNKAYTINLLNKLFSLKKTTPTLITTQNYIKMYNDIDYNQLQRLEYHTINNTFLDYSNPNHKEFIDKFKERFVEVMDDDLNTADAISVIFELVKEINTAIADMDASSKDAALDLITELCDVLGISKEKEDNILDSEVEALINERTEAKKAKNFAEADRIRDELKAMGIEIIDTPQGTKWRKV